MAAVNERPGCCESENLHVIVIIRSEAARNNALSKPPPAFFEFIYFDNIQFDLAQKNRSRLAFLLVKRPLARKDLHDHARNGPHETPQAFDQSSPLSTVGSRASRSCDASAAVFCLSTRMPRTGSVNDRKTAFLRRQEFSRAALQPAAAGALVPSRGMGSGFRARGGLRSPRRGARRLRHDRPARARARHPWPAPPRCVPALAPPRRPA